MLLTSAIAGDPAADLRLGFAIELAVLPPYLYSLWSIRPRSEGASDAAVEAANAIRSVVYEEMLHMGLVANILNALGDSPDVTDQLMTYPGPLPGHVTSGPYAFDVGLRRLGQESVATFMRIEQPEWDVPPPGLRDGGWTTIPEFYKQLKQQLHALPGNPFRHGRQLPRRDNPGAGRMLEVVNFDSAGQAIDIILDQGEGHQPPKTDDPSKELDYDHEVAHYYQFRTVKSYLDQTLIDPGRDLYPVIDNPDASRYSPMQKRANHEFNIRYSKLLDSLQSALTAQTPEVWGNASRLMVDLTHAAAVLRQCGNVPGQAYVAGPTFEYIHPSGAR